MAAQYIKHVNISIHKILSYLKSYENKAYIFFCYMCVNGHSFVAHINTVKRRIQTSRKGQFYREELALILTSCRLYAISEMCHRK
jgi:hypothetical protein